MPQLEFEGSISGVNLGVMFETSGLSGLSPLRTANTPSRVKCDRTGAVADVPPFRNHI